jgi:hypothetical protein
MPALPGGRRGTAVTIVLALAGITVAATLGWNVLAKGSGDPGGRIMAQLVPAASSLPGYGTGRLPLMQSPTMNGAYLTPMEPHQDSCDAMAGTQGWSQVVVQAGFTWSGSTADLFGHVGARLQSLGWKADPTGVVSDPQARWSKQLRNGSMAQVSLEAQLPSQWEFVVVAPPAGRAASGC